MPRRAITLGAMSRIALALALLAVAVLPAAADARFIVRPTEMLEAHLHNTDGQDWHVQMQANHDGMRLATVDDVIRSYPVPLLPHA